MKKALMSMMVLALVAPTAAFAGGDVVVAVESMARYEFLEDYTDFDDMNRDRSNFTFHRERVDVRAQASEDIAACIEVQGHGYWGQHFGPEFTSGDPHGSVLQDNGTTATIYQAYIDLDNIGGSLLSLQVGRQEHTLGNELHMGDNDFYVGQFFEGIRGNLGFESFDLEFFMYKVQENSTFNSFPGPGHSDDLDFWGLTSSFELEEGHNLEPYILYIHDGMDFGAKFATVGALYERERGDGPFDWSAEFAIQTGDQKIGAGMEADIDAHVFEGNFGFSFGNDSAHRVSIGGLLLSDGDDPTDFENFRGLFPDTHPRGGLMDLFNDDTFGLTDGFHNLENLFVDWNWTSGNNTFGAAYHQFSCAEKANCFNFSSDDDDLGSEIDLWWQHMSGKHITFAVNVGMFMPGDTFGTGPGAFDDDAMRANAMLRFRK